MNQVSLQQPLSLVRTVCQKIGIVLLWHGRLLMRVILAAVAALMILAGLWQFWVTPRLEQYRPWVVSKFSQAIGVPVQVGRLQAGWDGVRPQLAFLDVRVPDLNGGDALHFSRLEGALSWWALPTGRLHFSRLSLENPDLKIVRQRDGHWRVAGMVLASSEQSQPVFLNWLLEQGGLRIQQGRLSLHDELAAEPDVVLRDLDAQASNLFGRRKVSFSFFPPQEVASQVRGYGVLSGNDLTRLSDWSGRLRFDFPQTDLARLNTLFTGYLPDVFSRAPSVKKGLGRLALTVSFNKHVINQLDAELGLESLRIEQKGQIFELPVVNATARWVAGSTHERLLVNIQRLDGASGPLSRKGQFEYSLSDNERSIGLRGFTLGGLSAYSSWLPAGWSKKMTGAQVAGDIASLRYAWNGNWQQPTSWHGEADLRGLDLAMPAWLPHVGKLDVMARFDENKGSAILTSRSFQLNWPAQFLEPLALNRLDGGFSWKRIEQGWEIQANQMAVANAEAALNLSAKYQWTGKGLGYIDLTGDIARLPANRVYAYLPRGVGDDTLAWLKTSLLAGQASNGKAELRGELEHFPFVDGTPGKFLITTDARNVALSYADDWPTLTAIDGSLRFEGQSMTIHAPRAKVLDVQLQDIVTRIPDLSMQQHVLVDGTAEGQTANFLRFVQASPVREATQGFLDDLRATGAGGLELHLDIPIEDTDKTKLKGRYRFAENRLDFGGGIPLLTQAKGRVDFSETALKISEATAHSLGGTVKLSGASDDSGNLRLALSGDAQLTEVAQRYALPQPRRLSGYAAFQGELAVKRDRYDLTLQSPLTLSRIDLPVPMGKLAGESRNFRMRLNGNEQRTGLEFSYGRLLQGVLEQQGNKPYAGVISLGEGALAPKVPTHGIQLVGHWPAIDVSAWQSALAGGNNSEAPAITSVDLVFDSLTGWGRSMSDVQIQAAPITQGWSVQLASREASGALAWRAGARSSVTGRLKHLYLPLPLTASALNATGAGASAPVAENESNDLKPALDLLVDDFRYKTADLGKLVVNATPSGDGWQLNQISLTNPDGRLDMSGYWLGRGVNEHTVAKISMNSENSGKLLERMGYPEALLRAPAILTGEGRWQGAPLSPDLHSLQGKLHLDVQSGQFAQIKPGAARLLSVISLQSLPRRVKLDFRDVFSDGLEFDSISGDAVIENGIVRTDNLAIDGPAARIRFKGETNLPAGTQNLRVRIAPLIGDMASLAVGVVNPIAGVAAFALQRLLKDPLGQLVSYEYHISGDMLDPQVRKVSGDAP